ncbi:MAG: sodium/proton-translocating pyrophosphatase [Cyclobacteriaceae bacterium]|nr:sodium/proton-translocating pyrophosphatase [Cyclobacteriaceae bacterium]
MEYILYLVPVLAIIGLLVMASKAMWVIKQDSGDAKMADIAAHIREGALAFLSAEYRVLSVFVVIAGILLGVISYLVDTTHW